MPRTKLVFYVGGPIAVPGSFHWKSDTGDWGCFVAHKAGAKIPASAYSGDPAWHARSYPEFGTGASSTAILPIEVEV